LVAIVGDLSFHWLPSGPNFNSRFANRIPELPLSLLPSWQLSSGRSLPLCSPITAPSPRRKQGHRRRCGISSSGSSTFQRRVAAPLTTTGCAFHLLPIFIHKTSARHSRFPSPISALFHRHRTPRSSASATAAG
jgi:hypothetical protein